MTNINKRCVRFTEKNQIHTIERLNPNNIWFSQEEENIFRENFRLSVTECHKEMGNIYFNSLLNIYSYCKYQTDSTVSDKIITDMARCSDRRGLEFYAIGPIYQERIQRRQRQRKSILEIQRRIKQKGFELKDDRNGVLPKVAEVFSAPDKAFARLMGQVDEISAKQRGLKRSTSCNLETKLPGLHAHPSKRRRLSVSA
mmetsp:Transcript_18847/g.21007  ORF Transcript_18847/g.21007 Transcript_18847/m.21007 type:complete len:199 (-) Transcript_18847:87-683(-)